MPAKTPKPGDLEPIETASRDVGVGNADGEVAGATLTHQIKSLIGVTATVQIVASGGIERSLGKAKRVVDKRPKT